MVKLNKTAKVSTAAAIALLAGSSALSMGADGTLICSSCSVGQALRGCSVVDGECTCPEKLEGAGWAYTGPAMDVSMEVRGLKGYEPAKPDNGKPEGEAPGAGTRYEVSFDANGQATFHQLG